MPETNNDLDEFIKFHKRHFSLEAVIIWNHHHKCIYTSAVVNKYLGIDSLEDADTYDLEMLEELGVESIPRVRNKMLAAKTPYLSNYLLKNFNSNSYGIHQAMVFPIVDDQNEIIAFCSKIHQLRNDLLLGELIRRIKHYNGYDFANIPSVSQGSFSERELIIIFLMIIGAKYKVIAEILSNIYNQTITEGSVKVMINRSIHQKFNTNINIELVVTAISNGFLYDIPAKLVSRMPKIINVSRVADFYASYGIVM
jgi:DNA-binding NarL/FixJ family response regulator